VPRRKSKRNRLLRRIALAIAAVPAIYLLAALIGSLIPVNRDWNEPDDGITVYVANNGVHADLILPADTQGLDWSPLLPKRDFARPDPQAHWIAFGAGERRVYLDTPHWRDITLSTIWSALSDGERVMHVEWVRDPAYAARAVRLRPKNIAASGNRSERNCPRRHRPPDPHRSPGYGPDDAFYQGRGKANAISTCNVWASDRLRLAGVRTSLWTPFSTGLVWRYRKADPDIPQPRSS
jgi:uncharacterized protein (TIGR02117 family)